MQDSTLKILDATLKADESITPAERCRFLKLARGEPNVAPVHNGNSSEPRLYSRAKAAQLLGDRTPRYVDKLAQRGLLKKLTPRGNQRAIGICGDSLRQFIEGTVNGSVGNLN